MIVNVNSVLAIALFSFVNVILIVKFSSRNGLLVSNDNIVPALLTVIVALALLDTNLVVSLLY